MGKKIFNCNCEYKELKGTGNAKGFVLEKECNDCKLKREAAGIESAKERRKQEIISELNELDKKVIRPLLDGEVEKVEEIRTQKNLLREELRNL